MASAGTLLSDLDGKTPVFNKDDDLVNKILADMQNDYIGIRSYALFFAMISLSIQAFFFATGKTWIVLVSAIITASSNVILDYLLIFGKFSCIHGKS